MWNLGPLVVLAGSPGVTLIGVDALAVVSLGVLPSSTPKKCLK